MLKIKDNGSTPGRAKEISLAGSAKPKIVILMPMVWGLRNVVYSGVLKNLVEAGVDVHLLMREFDPAMLNLPEYAEFSLAAGCHALIRPPTQHKIKGRSFLRDVIHSAFSKRNHIGSYALYRRWYERNITPTQRRRSQLVEALGALAQPGPLFFNLYKQYDALCRYELDLSPIRTQLERIDPDLIWSTVNVEKDFERAYVLAARELELPVVNSILSFDNLTSKPAHLIYDHYLAWNNGMKEQLLRFYPQVSSEQVSVTGTPQFDFHRKPEFLWTRHKTHNQLGLPSDASYFLYTCGNQTLTPTEPDLVVQIAQRMQKEDTLRRCWLVVRTHPLDDWQRWNAVKENSECIILSQAWDNPPDAERWALPTRADQARFVSSMAHAEGCINIASTTSLDAAILDRPVIGIQFQAEKDAPTEILYEEYDADHYYPLVESGGLRLAHTWPELMSLMCQAITEPERDKENRARMVAQECGSVDGRAAERVTEALLNCLKEFPRRDSTKVTASIRRMEALK